jgi:hypothetical protein
MAQRMNTIIKKYSPAFLSAVLVFVFFAKPQAQGINGPAKNDQGIAANNIAGSKASKIIGSLQQRFQIFTGLAENEVYQITIAADVPDNRRPGKPYYKKEPGHVFVILEQQDTVTKKSIAQTWGFYPEHPISSLFVRTLKCKIVDNSNRQYDAAITQILSKEQFELVKYKAVELTSKKYNLNKYNCYDYAVELFNAIPGVDDLPLIKMKFPFIFGRGGSPCGLYKQIKALRSLNSSFKLFTGLSYSPGNSYTLTALHKN